MISKKHPNRKAYNWLLYNISDRSLMEHIPLYKGRLYDLGCGEAPFRDFFLQYADQYIGIDRFPGTELNKVDIIADLNKKLPVESGVADTVVSISVMEHLSEPQMMLNEACRILKSGGAIILQVPWQWGIHEAPNDYFRYTPYALRYLFDKAGFSNIHVKPQSGFFTVWIIKLNYFSLRLIRGPQIIQLLIKGVLQPFWYIGQLLAPHLDKLDKNWDIETQGYYVTARKA